MIKLKKIEKLLDKKGINYYRSENGQQICIKACSIGNNFYDYGETAAPIKINNEFSFLKNDHRIYILECCNCCECASW